MNIINFKKKCLKTTTTIVVEISLLLKHYIVTLPNETFFKINLFTWYYPLNLVRNLQYQEVKKTSLF